jgi:hypothetical protein
LRAAWSHWNSLSITIPDAFAPQPKNGRDKVMWIDQIPAAIGSSCTKPPSAVPFHTPNVRHGGFWRASLICCSTNAA